MGLIRPGNTNVSINEQECDNAYVYYVNLQPLSVEEEILCWTNVKYDLLFNFLTLQEEDMQSI